MLGSAAQNVTGATPRKRYKPLLRKIWLRPLEIGFVCFLFFLVYVFCNLLCFHSSKYTYHLGVYTKFAVYTLNFGRPCTAHSLVAGLKIRNESTEAATCRTYTEQIRYEKWFKEAIEGGE